MTAALVKRRHLASVWPPRKKDDLYCARGSREFFKRHGLDWGHFLRHGIARETLVSIGDAMALKAVQNADAEAERGR